MIFTSASAGLYKWVDNDGNVHYSQKPPRGQQFERLKAPSSAPENSKPLYQSIKQKSNTGNVAASESANNERIRTTNCTNAKNNLSSYQRSRRIRDKDGNVTTVDDNVRAQQIKIAKQAISDFCN